MQTGSEDRSTQDRVVKNEYSLSNELNRLTSIIAAHFLRSPQERFNQVLTNCIRMYSSLLKSRRTYVGVFDPDQEKKPFLHGWTSDQGFTAHITPIDKTFFNWMPFVVTSKRIAIVNIEPFGITQSDRIVLYTNDSSSPGIHIPIVSCGKTIGIWGFDGIAGDIIIDYNIMRAFRVASVMFTNILETQQQFRDGYVLENSTDELMKRIMEENRELKELNRLKSEFVSMTSHELRTPLTGIIGLTQTLRVPDMKFTPQEQDRYLSIIESEGMRLARLIRDLLDLSTIESGNLHLLFSEFKLEMLINEVLLLLKGLDQTDRQISQFIESSISVYADRDRIKQVLIILFDNALKYCSPEDVVTVTASKQNKGIIVSISDNGPGISSEEIEKIFTKFYRANNQRVNIKRGSGLGLAIAKMIIDAHGGKIWAEPRSGGGSTFSFVLNSIPCKEIDINAYN